MSDGMIAALIAASAGLFGSFLGAGVTYMATRQQLLAAAREAELARQERGRAEVRDLLADLLTRTTNWMAFALSQTQIHWPSLVSGSAGGARKSDLKTIEAGLGELKVFPGLLIELLLVVRDEDLRRILMELNEFFSGRVGIGLATRSMLSSFQGAPDEKTKAADLEALKQLGETLGRLQLRGQQVLGVV